MEVTIESIQEEINSIDQRVAILEKSNDQYMATYGRMNAGIYNEIQTLMDKRDELCKISWSLESVKVSDGNEYHYHNKVKEE